MYTSGVLNIYIYCVLYKYLPIRVSSCNMLNVKLWILKRDSNYLSLQSDCEELKISFSHNQIKLHVGNMLKIYYTSISLSSFALILF